MRVVAALAAAVLVVGACGNAGAPSPTLTASASSPPASAAVTTAPTTAPATTAATPTPGPTPLATAASTGDALATADRACRASTYRDAGPITVSVIEGEMVTIVYAHPEGDYLCQWLPRYGDTAVVQGGFTHFADQLTPETPIVRDQNMSWTGETGTYAWGAVSDAVASVELELGGAGDPIRATIANGYFLAIIGPTVQCCVFTVVAYDKDGREIARLQ